jgi:small ubiquitin-related modifier
MTTQKTQLKAETPSTKEEEGQSAFIALKVKQQVSDSTQPRKLRPLFKYLVTGWCSLSFQNETVHGNRQGAIFFLQSLLCKTFLQLMAIFCEQQSFDPRSIKFMYEGNSLSPRATPESLSMEDGDEIDAFVAQIGGGLTLCFHLLR